MHAAVELLSLTEYLAVRRRRSLSGSLISSMALINLNLLLILINLILIVRSVLLPSVGVVADFLSLDLSFGLI